MVTMVREILLQNKTTGSPICLLAVESIFIAREIDHLVPCTLYAMHTFRYVPTRRDNPVAIDVHDPNSIFSYVRGPALR